MTSSTSSALDRAFHLLRQDLLGYIDAVAELTNEANDDDEEILTVARDHVPNLISALRGVIGKHHADVFGLCLGCGPTLTGDRFVRQPWPCPTISEIHKYMTAPETVYGSVHAP